MEKIKSISIPTVLVFAIVTRFLNLSWGLPYPFHPDERNMAVAIQQLNCSSFIVHSSWLTIRECFNPHFFAYGQLPLYGGYVLIQIYHFLFTSEHMITLTEAIMSLRIISAIASVGTIFVGVRIVQLLSFPRKRAMALRSLRRESRHWIPDQVRDDIAWILTALLFIFSPALIQFAHFGTTESLLMLFNATILYTSLLVVTSRIQPKRLILVIGILAGLAIGTKISSVIFLGLPLLVFGIYKRQPSSIFILAAAALFTSVISSPHNFLSFREFINSINYESGVAMGDYNVFYTKQFFESLPILFQFTTIFPYALGMVNTILFVAGFFLLPFDKKHNLLRLALLVYLIPTAFFYAKWTRFMAPVMPVMLVISALFLLKIYHVMLKRILTNHVFCFLILISILPGIAYLTIYLNEDVRVTASRWIFKNIPQNSLILSETANVVDIPIPASNEDDGKNYKVISLNFYDLDSNPQLMSDLQRYLVLVDYIIVPSRRVFANHTCARIDGQQSMVNSMGYKEERCSKLKQKYPILNSYYDNLFGEKLGYKKIAEFNSYPAAKFLGGTINFPDEKAEETWSVFDHPVIRIYKRQ